MKKNKQLNIQVTGPQADFHKLTCKYPAFVGGFGSGKSEAMCNQAIMDASVSRHALIAMYAPTYDLVRLILAPRLMAKLEEFGIKYDYNQTKNLITTFGGQFGSFILRSLDSPERIVGYESYRSHIDEIDILRISQAREAWIKILGRNRQRLPDVPKDKQLNRVCAYSTPEGFNFLYDRWVKNKVPGYELVQARSESNPFLPADYIQSLKDSYPEELISAYLNGEFVNLNTGTVYKSFDRVLHNSKETITRNEPLYIGCDFNVTNMSASIFVKRGNQFHAVDELCKMYDTPAMIEIMNERYEGHHIIIYPDASGKSRKSVNASTSDIALLQEAGYEIRVKSKNPFVKDRIMAVNTAFSKGLLFVNVDNCPSITECLEQQSYDDSGEPDKKAGKDHQNDATGYVIAFELPIRKPIARIDVGYI